MRDLMGAKFYEPQTKFNHMVVRIEENHPFPIITSATNYMGEPDATRMSEELARKLLRLHHQQSLESESNVSTTH